MKTRATTTMTAKLPILNLVEYDLWLMKIEQYFLMIDYSLWEVIKNGNKVLTKPVGSSEQTYEPTIAEEKPDRRNEMKAKRTLLMALPKKDQLNTSNTNEANTTASGVSTTHTQGNIVNATTIDNLSDAMICAFLASQPNTPQLAKVDLEQIDPDRIGGYDWIYQAEEETPTNYAFMALTSSGSSSSSDSEVDSCSKTKVKLRDRVLAEYTQNMEKVEKERDELKLTLEILQNSSKSLNTLLNSQVSDKSKAGLGYKELIPESFVNSSELLEKQNNRSTKGYHEVPPLLIGNYMPPKRDLRLIDEHFKSESVDVSTVSSNDDKIVKTVDITHKGVLSTEEPKFVMKNNFGPPIIEDWHSDDDSKDEFTHFLTISAKLNTAATSVNTDTRPFNKLSSNKRSFFNKKVNTIRVNDSTARERAVVSGNIGREVNVVKASACWVWKAKNNSASTTFKKYSYIDARGRSKRGIKKKESLTVVVQAHDGGFVSFADGKGRIFGKGKIKTGKLDFDDVYFCKELKYNLINMSQMCDKKNNVLFTDTECLILSSNIKLLDESRVLQRVPRKDNIYNVDLKSVVPNRDLTCLFAKATLDESNLWHRRLRQINFKTINKLVRGNPVRGIENQLDCKVKVIRSDNRTEFKNSVMTQFCDDKVIKREYSIARTPHQNRVAERRNRTLIEAARTMLVDSKLPTTFWAEVVNTACYVLNRALVTKPHNKTPYELIPGRPPLIDFMKPFGCPITILNTRGHLGKFEGKANKGYFVGYLVVSNDMRVFNKRTRIVEETLNIRFQENVPNVKGNRPGWLFDIDSLTISMNYVPVVTGNQTNGIAGTKEKLVAGQDERQKALEQEYILITICITGPLISQDAKDRADDAGKKDPKVDASEASNNGGQDNQVSRNKDGSLFQQDRQTAHNNSANNINTVSSPVSTAGPSFVNAASQIPLNVVGPSLSTIAFKEHSFERFSPFKNAFSLPLVLMVTPIDDT
uniref:Ribonuclease H-like domain-containing protein n=1 Tax=Tanacetum cinerariifolium TaxID=118510 RepID=A0A6L2KF04_TANCI|nr:ribonuclease H-like domain-containing protein [Tanacetum cinerariifolium]